MVFNRSSTILFFISYLARTESLDHNNIRQYQNKEHILSEETVDKLVDSLHRATSIKATALNDNVFGAQSLGTCNILAKMRAKRKKRGTHNFLNLKAVQFSESFEGLKVEVPKGVIGMGDELVGTPRSPLTLKANTRPRQTLYVDDFCKENNGRCGIRLKGQGPSGVKGSGCFSMKFTEDKMVVEMSFRSSGASQAEALFYKRDGTHIGTLQVDIEENTDYRFTDEDGLIAGVSIVPRGNRLIWHKLALVGLCLHGGVWF